MSIALSLLLNFTLFLIPGLVAARIYFVRNEAIFDCWEQMKFDRKNRQYPECTCGKCRSDGSPYITLIFVIAAWPLLLLGLTLKVLGEGLGRSVKWLICRPSKAKRRRLALEWEAERVREMVTEPDRVRVQEYRY